MKKLDNVAPGTFGVFLWDEANPPKLWEFIGTDAEGENVFTRGTVSRGDFELLHWPLVDFWPLAEI